VVPQAWSDLPGVALARLWQEIALARRSADLVVVDVGSLVRVRELVALPGVLVRLLDASLTPRAAMWRGSAGEGGLFESLSEARVDAMAWLSIATAETTSVRLVARPKPDSADAVLRTGGVLAMLGIQLEGVIVNRFPRRRDDAPSAVRRQAREALAVLQEGLPGIPVWRSTSRLRPVPKGHAAADIIPATGSGPTLRDRDLAAIRDGVVEGADEYLLTVPLVPVVRDEARVGVQGDHLVVAFDGVHAFAALPPVLRRCIPREARRGPDGLVIRWSPDQDVWPGERAS
jgi:arsenite-transporting ATPase